MLPLILAFPRVDRDGRPLRRRSSSRRSSPGSPRSSTAQAPEGLRNLSAWALRYLGQTQRVLLPAHRRLPALEPARGRRARLRPSRRSSGARGSREPPARRPLPSVAVSPLIWAVSAYLLWQTKVPSSLHLPHVDTKALFPADELHRADSYDHVAAILYRPRAPARVRRLRRLLLVGARGSSASPRPGRSARGCCSGCSASGCSGSRRCRSRCSRSGGTAATTSATRATGTSSTAAGSRSGSSSSSSASRSAIVMGLARLVGKLVVAARRARLRGARRALRVHLAVPRVDAPDRRSGAPHDCRPRSSGGLTSATSRCVIQDVSGETSAAERRDGRVRPDAAASSSGTRILDGRFSPGEVEVVIAHELGHAKRNHILKSIAWYALIAIPVAYVISRVTRPARRHGRARGGPARAARRSSCSSCSRYCRSRTRSRGTWRPRPTGSRSRPPAIRRTAIRALQAFVPTTLSDPNPPTWEYLLAENHPTIDQRIAMMQAWQRDYATSASAAQLP